MFFKDIIGQTFLKSHLVDMVRNNRISHALLFLGKEGSGALPLAIAFAQFIVCEKVNGPASNPGPSLFGEVSNSPLTTHPLSHAVSARPVLKRHSWYTRIFISLFRLFPKNQAISR